MSAAPMTAVHAARANRPRERVDLEITLVQELASRRKYRAHTGTESAFNVGMCSIGTPVTAAAG